MCCCPLWFNSTSSSIEKLKTSYNSALRNLLLIKKPYSASTMFVTLFTNYFALATIGLQFVSVKLKLYYNGMHDPVFIFTLPFGNGGDQCYINLQIFYFVIF